MSNFRNFGCPDYRHYVLSEPVNPSKDLELRTRLQAYIRSFIAGLGLDGPLV